MLSIRIVEGHNRIRVAHVSHRGILYRGKTYVPTELRVLDQSTGDSVGGLIGATVGGALLGPAGIVAGSVLGNRGRTTVILTTASGRKLVCTVPASEFAELYVEVERLKALPADRVAAFEGKPLPVLWQVAGLVLAPIIVVALVLFLSS